MKMNKAVFIDKDGTLIPNTSYYSNPDLITLSANAVDGLKKLSDHGYQLIVVSSQPGFPTNHIEEKHIIAIESKIDYLLNKFGIFLSGFYYYPLYPQRFIDNIQVDLDCRRLKAGLLKEAAKAHRIDLLNSWMIGDVLDDIDAGNRAACQTILINNGNELFWEMNYGRTPNYIAKDINQAADYILATGQKQTFPEQKCFYMD